MKESEFIELLNLYLDHEISAADAARLEAEVAASPARRRIYEDYCRMQKACKALAADFATEAAPAERNIVAFEAARPQRRVGLYGAGVFAAAAACVAVMLLGRNSQDAASPESSASQATFAATSAPAAAPAVAQAATPAAAMPTTSAQLTTGDTVLIAGASGASAAPQAKPRGLSLGSNPTAVSEALLVAAEQNATPFDWLHTTKLDPVQRVQIDQFRFDARAPRAVEIQPTVVRGNQQGVMVESAAFKMTK